MTEFPETIPELLSWRRERSPERVWLRFEGESWTHADVAAEVDRFAVGLAERGVGKGDRVALILGNRPETLFGWFAANQLGAVAASLNPAFKAPEIAALLSAIAPRVVISDGLHESAVSPSELRSGGPAPRATVLPDDVAVWLASSGTTGAPKTIPQTHRAYTLTAEAFPDWLGLDENDRLLTALPLFHINAQAYSTMGALGAGAGLSLLRKFSASRFWTEAREHDATEVNVVGAMLHILMKTAPSPADREHRVRLCYAALALPEALHRAFEARFGLTLTVGYGLSETPFGTIWPKDEPPRYGSMGRLRQHPRLGEINYARVENGELWLRNPAIAPGAAEPDGWFRTGDLVRRDADGFFTFVSRLKEVIRRRGENVAAAEIENVLLAHPLVGEAAVVPAPAELGEDEIVAYVAPRAGATIDLEELRAFVRERLADFKVPSLFHVRESLPRTATERVAKYLLK